MKFTRVEAARESLGGMYGAGETRGGPGAQLEGSAEALLPWGGGPSVLPAPRALLPHLTTWQ